MWVTVFLYCMYQLALWNNVICLGRMPLIHLGSHFCKPHNDVVSPNQLNVNRFETSARGYCVIFLLQICCCHSPKISASQDPIEKAWRVSNAVVFFLIR